MEITTIVTVSVNIIILYFIWKYLIGNVKFNFRENVEFWKKVQNDPQSFAEHVMSEEEGIWVVEESSPFFDKKEYSGPFYFYSNLTDKTVKIYGKSDKYEDSQKRYLINVKKNLGKYDH